MSRTVRNKRPQMRLGAHLGGKQYKNGKVRDGTPQHASSRCRHHGSCEYCAGNRQHANKKREPVMKKETRTKFPEGTTRVLNASTGEIKQVVAGCSNHGCFVAKVRKKGSIGTNGICSCLRDLPFVTRVQVERIHGQFIRAEELIESIDRVSHDKAAIHALIERYYAIRDPKV